MSTTTQPKKAPAKPACRYLPAKPNPMFPPELTALLRFVRFPKHFPCALCGAKKRTHWTMLCEFIAHNPGPNTFSLSAATGTAFPALTPVCSDHFMQPAEAIRRALWT